MTLCVGGGGVCHISGPVDGSSDARKGVCQITDQTRTDRPRASEHDGRTGMQTDRQAYMQAYSADHTQPIGRDRPSKQDRQARFLPYVLVIGVGGHHDEAVPPPCLLEDAHEHLPVREAVPIVIICVCTGLVCVGTSGE